MAQENLLAIWPGIKLFSVLLLFLSSHFYEKVFFYMVLMLVFNYSELEGVAVASRIVL